MAVLVTEYVDGFDLGQLIQRTGPLKVSDACEIARQVAVALEYTHQQGFVHRDVKPSNVMLSHKGEVKLLDLGLARLQYGEADWAEITGTGQAMGTADYVAPEQVTDSRSVDIRADIYALGCTLFKLLTGNAPFADQRHVTAFAKMTAHVSTEAPSLAECLHGAPAGLIRLVNSMLKKSPDARPQKPSNIAAALQSFVEGSDLPALADRAVQLEPAKPQPRPSTLSPARTPWWQRQISVGIAVALTPAGTAAWALPGSSNKDRIPRRNHCRNLPSRRR